MRRGGAQVIPREFASAPGSPNPWVGVLGPQHVTIAAVETALAELAAGRRPIVDTGQVHLPIAQKRPAAVLIPLFAGADGETRVVLTRRASHLRSHRGEVAFPGGRVDDGETDVQAALREAEEEIGLSAEHVRIIGRLEPLATLTSSASVAPFVGVVDVLPTLTHNPDEVERIFDVGLLELADPECYREEVWQRPEGSHRVHFFEVEHDTVWGVTGRLLYRLLMLLMPPSA